MVSKIQIEAIATFLMIVGARMNMLFIMKVTLFILILLFGCFTH